MKLCINFFMSAHTQQRTNYSIRFSIDMCTKFCQAILILVVNFKGRFDLKALKKSSKNLIKLYR
jgi:hypothetical protein